MYISFDIKVKRTPADAQSRPQIMAAMAFAFRPMQSTLRLGLRKSFLEKYSRVSLAHAWIACPVLFSRIARQSSLRTAPRPRDCPALSATTNPSTLLTMIADLPPPVRPMENQLYQPQHSYEAMSCARCQPTSQTQHVKNGTCFCLCMQRKCNVVSSFAEQNASCSIYLLKCN